MEFLIALVIGIAVSLFRGFNHKSRAYQFALSEGRYADFAIGITVGALPFVLIAWIVLAIL